MRRDDPSKVKVESEPRRKIVLRGWDLAVSLRELGREVVGEGVSGAGISA